MAAARITVVNNASLRVEGDFEIVDQEGKPFGLAGRTRVSLCRCGQSSNKPFCDSAHKTCAFDSTLVAFELPPPAPKPDPAAASVAAPAVQLATQPVAKPAT
jgi:CDGSH-type Zn-finger protein